MFRILWAHDTACCMKEGLCLCSQCEHYVSSSAMSVWPCRQHRIDVDKVLKPKGNTLSITIKPAVPEALSRKEAYPYAVPFVKVGRTSVLHVSMMSHQDTTKLGCNV